MDLICDVICQDGSRAQVAFSDERSAVWAYLESASSLAALSHCVIKGMVPFLEKATEVLPSPPDAHLQVTQ